MSEKIESLSKTLEKQNEAKFISNMKLEKEMRHW